MAMWPPGSSSADIWWKWHGVPCRKGILYDAVSETVQCLPDAIQLLTPCTVGNGWLKVYHFGIYALSLYDKYTGEGTRVRLNVEALDAYPHVRAWFLKEKPKREQEPELLREEIRHGRHGPAPGRPCAYPS